MNSRHQKGDEFTNKKITKLEMISFQGMTILSKTFEPTEEVRIDLPIDCKGFYLLKVTDSEGNNYTKKMLVSYKD